MKEYLPSFMILDSKNERELVLSLIKDPFYDFRDEIFQDKEWIKKWYLNDFFITEENFAEILELMNYSNEEYFYITNAPIKDYTKFFKIPRSFDIQKMRQDISARYEIYNSWYFFSPNGNWAAISEYDGDSLFIGYDNKLESIRNL